MPDTDLHELLREISLQVVVPDLLPEVEKGVRVRHRRLIALACLATLVVLGAAAAGATELASAGNKHSPDTVGRPSPRPTDTPSSAVQSTTSVLPAYLPPGASLRHTGLVRYPRPMQPQPKAQRAHESWYHLAGRRNADTIPKGGPTGATIGNPDIHTGTSLDVTFVPASNLGGEKLQGMLPPLGKHAQSRRVSVNVAGNRALITIDTNEHGAIRIDWLDSAGYHSIGEDRVITPRGLSGVGRSELIRMARSLYR